ncbi:hypothetical protein HXP44_19150 [Streptomyces sioyaensis]|uniref:Secreted protein n=1 Tax=Streptomyces sioyaensis TaxID=67364 RepID=A0A4Q1QNL5_9ACTN|nr:hypothetical protein [Streptomyces sioyaensis]MBM4794128.1 hypothetical protein [Streptomyces sioyaensis]RXS60764.1 hypothetical protein EST54_27350 [Streptomyces sioyaensis]
MKIRRIAAAMGVLVAGAASVLTTSVPAQADVAKPPSSATCTNIYSDPGEPGVACFDPNGDKVYIGDSHSDGLRAVAQITSHDFGGGLRECHDANGAGNGFRVCDFDFPEDKMVNIVAVGRSSACGPVQGCDNKKAGFPISVSTS